MCWKETAGVVVASGPKGQEKIFKAYFSSCCGGITQSAADAFGDPPSEPLSDHKAPIMCNESPRFNWGPVVIRKDELTRRIKNWGISKGRAEKDIGMITRLDIAYVNRFGRPIRFTITDVQGRRFSINGTDLRAAINSAVPGTTVFSSFFTPVDEPDAIRLVDGHGFGHGVGLCQYCAQAQAEQGVPHEQIILDAFPGASLQRAY